MEMWDGEEKGRWKMKRKRSLFEHFVGAMGNAWCGGPSYEEMEKRKAAWVEKAKEMFAQIDKNDDKTLTAEEIVHRITEGGALNNNLWSMFGVGRECDPQKDHDILIKQFEAVDVDKDSQVTEKEFIDFYCVVADYDFMVEGSS